MGVKFPGLKMTFSENKQKAMCCTHNFHQFNQLHQRLSLTNEIVNAVISISKAFGHVFAQESDSLCSKNQILCAAINHGKLLLHNYALHHLPCIPNPQWGLC